MCILLCELRFLFACVVGARVLRGVLRGQGWQDAVQEHLLPLSCAPCAVLRRCCALFAQVLRWRCAVFIDGKMCCAVLRAQVLR